MGLSLALAVFAAIPFSAPYSGPITVSAAPNGSQARWLGVNVWGLAASEDVYGCGGSVPSHQQTLDDTFATLKQSGVTVVRFWAFQSYAINSAGARDWTALDRVFNTAQRNGIRLIPVLGNNWRSCDYWPISLYPNGGQNKSETNWYAGAYTQPSDGYLVSYQQWVGEIARRYSKSKVVIDWELVNEPEAQSTQAGDIAAFRAFLTDIASRVHVAAPNTPVSLGSIGTGQAGFANADYASSLKIPGVSMATAHDYNYANDPLPISPSCSANCIRADIATAKSLGRPIFIGEAGDTGCDDVNKANRYKAKIQAAFEAGASGYILWAFSPYVAPGNCGYDFGPGSAMMSMLAGLSFSKR